MKPELRKRLIELSDRLEIDLPAMIRRHDRLNAKLVAASRRTDPLCDAAVIEFVFEAKGNPKRRLLRRLVGLGTVSPRGLVIHRCATPFEFLTYETVSMELTAVMCGLAPARWGRCEAEAAI